MFSFSQKLTPFSSSSINLGPAYIDRLFDVVLAKEGVPVSHVKSRVERLQLYQVYLCQQRTKVKSEMKPYLSFYYAYFLQALGNEPGHLLSPSEVEEAILNYRWYLKSSLKQEESRFYAQWQIGRLLDQEHSPWILVQKELLLAVRLDNERGESIREIVTHYMSSEDWENAYLFSTYARHHYFDRNPMATRRWHVNIACYNWRALERHLTISRQLHLDREAEQVYQQLIEYFVKYPNELNETEMAWIKSMRRYLKRHSDNYQLVS